MKLRVTLPALADLETILADIDRHSPSGAQRVKARIRTILDLLVEHPMLGARTSDPAVRRMMPTPARHDSSCPCLSRASTT
ncbi:type II toxin-antitoxin system RelE/ParE family toxin [Blastochloris sulfoviridis]|uniref:type II toxin-antitoxin system RelE/ParE family toxin n=1 Tax=Blastochloris sulfoviridis TaxID=50712 RepID=UPI001478E31B